FGKSGGHACPARRNDPRPDQPVPRGGGGDDRRRHRSRGDAPRDRQESRAGAGQEDGPTLAQARQHPCMKSPRNQRLRRDFAGAPQSAPVVITAALTGVLATRDQCPAIPYTPAEIADEAKRAADAGAAIVHIHARTREGGPDWSVETFAAILSEVRAKADIIVNFSTGAVGIPAEQRI